MDEAREVQAELIESACEAEEQFGPDELERFAEERGK